MKRCFYCRFKLKVLLIFISIFTYLQSQNHNENHLENSTKKEINTPSLKKRILPSRGGLFNFNYSFYGPTSFKANEKYSMDIQSIYFSTGAPLFFVNKIPSIIFSINYQWNYYNFNQIENFPEDLETHKIGLGFTVIPKKITQRWSYFSLWILNIQGDLKVVSDRNVGWVSVNLFIYTYNRWALSLGLNFSRFIGVSFQSKSIGRFFLIPGIGITYKNNQFEADLSFPISSISYAPIYGVVLKMGFSIGGSGAYYVKGENFNRSNFTLNNRGWKMFWNFQFLLNRKKGKVKVWQFFEVAYSFGSRLNIEDAREVDINFQLKDSYQIKTGFYLRR